MDFDNKLQAAFEELERSVWKNKRRPQIFKVSQRLGLKIRPQQYRSETVVQLTEDFHNAIDHYLADCEKEGLVPAKPYSGKLTLRVSPNVHAEIAAAAAHSGKSINKWLADTLTQVVHSQ